MKDDKKEDCTNCEKRQQNARKDKWNTEERSKGTCQAFVEEHTLSVCLMGAHV